LHTGSDYFKKIMLKMT